MNINRYRIEDMSTIIIGMNARHITFRKEILSNISVALVFISSQSKDKNTSWAPPALLTELNTEVI
jgi:hypothetical protein